jgi:hypothetical protein
MCSVFTFRLPMTQVIAANRRVADFNISPSKLASITA